MNYHSIFEYIVKWWTGRGSFSESVVLTSRFAQRSDLASENALRQDVPSEAHLPDSFFVGVAAVSRPITWNNRKNKKPFLRMIFWFFHGGPGGARVLSVPSTRDSPRFRNAIQGIPHRTARILTPPQHKILLLKNPSFGKEGFYESNWWTGRGSNPRPKD